MVDLRIHQHDGPYRRIANRPCGLQFRKSLVLGQKVGRSIEQNPVTAIAADRNRRLRSRRGAQGCFAHSVAIAAVAVPLRESASGGGTQNSYAYGHWIG